MHRVLPPFHLSSSNLPDELETPPNSRHAQQLKAAEGRNLSTNRAGDTGR